MNSVHDEARLILMELSERATFSGLRNLGDILNSLGYWHPTSELPYLSGTKFKKIIKTLDNEDIESLYDTIAIYWHNETHIKDIHDKWV